METVTIHKELSGKGELVVISKREYEEFLSFRKMFKIVNPTKVEKRVIERGKKEFLQGKFTPLEKITHGVARRSR